MAISYSGEGYKFQPQFANLGALQGLQPLDVTRRAQFETRPLTYAEIPSSRPEIVSEGFSKGILAAVGGITEGITAKYKSEQAKEEKASERAHEIQVANIKASGYDDTLTRQKALYDYKLDKDTKKRLEGSLGANYPVYMDGETTEEPVTENVPIDEELPDLETPLSETSVDGTSLFSTLTPADQMQGQIAEQAKQLEGLSPEYLTVGTEGGAVAPIQAAPIMSLEGLKVTAISPEQSQKTLETRQELRKTLSGIQAPKVVKEQPQQPGWRPIAQAEAEAGREISGWQKAEIDPKNVQMIGGVPHFLVLPRKAKSEKEMSDEAKAQSEAKKAAETGVNFETEKKLRDEYVGQTKDFKTIQSAWRSIKTSGGEPSAAGDMSLIFGYMKLLDPGSTVREGEYANAQNAGGVPDRVVASYNKLINGQILSESQRKDFLGQAKKQYDSRLGEYSGLKKSYTELAKEYGLEPKRVVVSFDMPEEVTKGQVEQNRKQQLESELNSMQAGTPEYQKTFKELVDIIKAEKTAQKLTPQATVKPTQQSTFKPAVPRQPQQYGETLESFLGN